MQAQRRLADAVAAEIAGFTPRTRPEFDRHWERITSGRQFVASGIYVRETQLEGGAFEAIERAVAGLPDAKRPFLRSRLFKSVAANRIRLSSTGNRVSIVYDAKAPIVLWLGGGPVKWKLAEWFVYDVSAKADGDAISLTFRGSDGERTVVYHSVGRDLVEETSIVTPLLSAPITYKLVYNRAN